MSKHRVPLQKELDFMLPPGTELRPMSPDDVQTALQIIRAHDQDDY